MISFPRDGHLVVFDTEYTSWDGAMARDFRGPGEHREVVQIGAVRLDAADRLVETGALSILVRPTVNPGLSAYFTDLTGITQARVDAEGVGFAEALARFRAFCAGAAMVLANGSDGEVMAENCRLNGLPAPDLPFADASRWLAARLGDTAHVASWSLPGRLGLDPPAAAHDALHDARAVAAALRHFRGG